MAKRYRSSGPSEKHFPIVAILLGFVLIFVIWYFFFRREGFYNKIIKDGFENKTSDSSPCDGILIAGDCDKNTLCSWGIDPMDPTKTKNKCMAKPPAPAISEDHVATIKNMMTNLTAMVK
jgi:hypothetical protein